MNKRFIENIIYAFGAQGAALLLSVITTLLLPKFLGETQFAYWQLFVFYSLFGGFVHFGLNDGVYLRLGGCKRNDLRPQRLGAELKISLIWESLIGLIIAILFSTITEDNNRVFVVVCCCICTLINNAYTFLSYILQAINETKHYSISVIIDRLMLLSAFVLCMIFSIDEWHLFIVLYMTSRCIALVYCVTNLREIIFSKSIYEEIFVEIKNDIYSGISLVFSNVASMLIIGAGRLIVDGKWGLLEFSQVSFGVTLTNFVLVFAGQIGMVLFPALRTYSESEQKGYYIKIRALLSKYMPIFLLSYFPLNILLTYWLPIYSRSILYFSILIPLCIFDSNMQLLYATFLKVFRKERKLLLVNIIACLTSVVFSMSAAYVFDKLIIVVYGMLIALMLRSYISELILLKHFHIHSTFTPIREITIVIIYLIIINNISNLLLQFTFVLLMVLLNFFLIKKR